MDVIAWTAIGVCVTIVITLIGVIYNRLLKQIDEVKLGSKNGLALKVDEVEFRITKEWQREISDDIRLVIKDLSDANTKEHAGILLEIKRLITK